MLFVFSLYLSSWQDFGCQTRMEEPNQENRRETCHEGKERGRLSPRHRQTREPASGRWGPVRRVDEGQSRETSSLIMWHFGFLVWSRLNFFPVYYLLSFQEPNVQDWPVLLLSFLGLLYDGLRYTITRYIST